MENIELLFEKNPEICQFPIKLSKDKRIVIDIKDKEFNGNTVKKVINIVNGYRLKYNNQKFPIIILFTANEILINDKLCYVLLECIFYYVICNLKIPIQIFWNPKLDILTSGLESSPLLLLNTMDKKDVLRYGQKFRMDIYKNHFRKVIEGKDKTNTNYLGNIYEQIDIFLKIFLISDDNRNQIAEVISELVGNACEHGNSDCLIDIDITDDHRKSEDGKALEGAYYGINISVINFSNQLIGDALKEKIESVELTYNGRYEYVKNAYEYHKTKFNDNYDETDFFNISVFQDKISGRKKYQQSGGTGLTLLIKSLQEKSDCSKCYMISGNKSIFFYNQLLEYTNDEWLGFNSSHRYADDIPDEEAHGGCYIYMPGTAFNFNFVMKRED